MTDAIAARARRGNAIDAIAEAATAAVEAASAAKAQLSTHEQVCAVRYGNIIGRVGRLERVVMLAAGS